MTTCGPAPEAEVDRGALGGLDDGPPAPAEIEGEREGEREERETPCPTDLSRCRFERYNLDVRVGDRFVLSNFLERCDGDAGVDFAFAYEGDTTWNLAAFNADAVVEIVEADLEGGNHGDGEYRLDLVDARGRELDHATIRIDHDDRSDVRGGDDIAPAPYQDRCEPGDAGTPDPTDGAPTDDRPECGEDCV